MHFLLSWRQPPTPGRGRVPNPNPGAAAGETIPMPAFVFGAKSQKRLGIACEFV